MPFTSRIPLVVTPRSNSRRPRCPLLSDWWTGAGPQNPCPNNSRVNHIQPLISLMMKGRNNGKKLLALRIVAHAFEIIHLLTDQNPIQVCTPNGINDLVLIRSRCWLMPSSTLDPVKIPPVLAHKEPSVVRLSMSRLCDELTRPSPS